MIQTENLSFVYSSDDSEEQSALYDINIKINDGEFVAILGKNGSGKSTLAKHFNSILLPSGGKVYVDGMDTSDESLMWNIRSNTGMVFQNPDNQIVATVVEEVVAFAAENLSVPSAEIRKRVDKALQAVGMFEYRKHAPHLLSGGQKQRVAIAGVIAMEPKTIIFDEPTAMLDPSGRKEVLKTIIDLNRKHGITIVLITHNMDEAVCADRVIVMNDGRVLCDDKPHKVFSDVENIKNIGLDVPQVTYLAYLLKKKGIDIKNDILTEQEFIEEFMKLCQSK